MKFQLHTLESAPAASQPLLENSIKGFGMIPNLHAVMAEAPAVLEAYQTLHRLFQETSFDLEELTVIWQTINVENECHYCIPAHTAISQMMSIDSAITDALRNRTELPTKKLQTLHLTTLALLNKRGKLNDEELATFVEVGYGQRQLLEIILGMSQKMMSNYINKFAHTPIDDAFAPFV
jgi:alkylhydroperoxidase family enzyme